jgi:hypothetical protein
LTSIGKIDKVPAMIQHRFGIIISGICIAS